MKFVGFVLGDVNGISIFPIIGILIFLILFAVILYRTFKMTRVEVETIKNSILDNQENSNSDSQ